MVLEVAKSLVEALRFHAVLDLLQSFVLALNFSNNSVLICLKLAALVVVMVVPLNFCECGGVVEGMGHLSQQMVGFSTGLE